jgi:cell division protein FtsI/penicillin-binding protein 2
MNLQELNWMVKVHDDEESCAKKEITGAGNNSAMDGYRYECRMTPLQILRLYNAVANDGKMMKPISSQKLQEKEEYKKIQAAGSR